MEKILRPLLIDCYCCDCLLQQYFNNSQLFVAILTRYNSWSVWEIVFVSRQRCFRKLSVNISANKTKVIRLVWQDGLNLGTYIIPDDFTDDCWSFRSKSMDPPDCIGQPGVLRHVHELNMIRNIGKKTNCSECFTKTFSWLLNLSLFELLLNEKSF